MNYPVVAFVVFLIALAVTSAVGWGTQGTECIKNCDRLVGQASNEAWQSCLKVCRDSGQIVSIYGYANIAIFFLSVGTLLYIIFLVKP